MTLTSNFDLQALWYTRIKMKTETKYLLCLRTQFQMNKTVRIPLVFPFVCCKSNYEEYISFSQILPGSLLKHTSHLQHGLSKDFTWEKSKLLNQDYIKGFIAGHWVIVLTVAATTNQTWNQRLLCSMTCGHTSHWKFKTQQHEIPLGHHRHTTFNPQQLAQLKIKIKNPNRASTICMLGTAEMAIHSGNTQWKKKEANT